MTTAMSQAERISVDLYSGAYGLTIRLDAQTREGLSYFQDAVRGLSNGSIDRFEIADDSRFQLSGLTSLVLASPSPVKQQGLRRGPKSAGTSFKWEMSRDDWKHIVSLIGGLIGSLTPCHQYLTVEGGDDAFVELAFMERTGREGVPRPDRCRGVQCPK